MSTNGYVAFALFCALLRATDGQFSCPKQLDNCTCSYSQSSSIDVNCPNERDSFLTIAAASEEVKINCRNSSDYIPELDISNAKRVSVQDCFFQDDFQTVLNKLNLHNVEALKFEMCPDPMQCNHSSFILKKNFMRGLEQLHVLHMPYNFITEIQGDVFDGMRDLERVDLCNNKLTTVPNIFDNTPNVEWIDLSRNEITHLPESIFNNLPKLKMLHLYANNISSVSDKLFRDLRKVTVLELGINEIQDVPENLLQSLQNLTKVNLSRNKITRLPEGLFRNNLRLTEIRLQGNKIKELPSNIFRNLTKLEKLALDSNQLQTLPADLFSGLVNLKQLNLGDNLLKTVDNLFLKLNRLENLILGRNKISSLSDDLFKGLKNLKELSLKNNGLTNISIGIPLATLKNLYLEHNNISNIEVGAFRNLNRLQKLNLSFNKLATLQETDIYTSFNYLLQIEELDLSSNNLKYVYIDFINKTKLRKLNLAYNNISSVTLSDLKTIAGNTEIHLEHNQIEIVRFDGLYLFAAELRNEDTITKIFLSGNPISCNCTAFDLSQYYDSSANFSPVIRSRFLIDDSGLKCASPRVLAGRQFESVKSEELSCPVVSSCPTNCTCETRPYNRSLIINCAYEDLKKVPALPWDLPWSDENEVHLEGNLLKEFEDVNLGYERVTRLYLQNNKLRTITWIPPNIKTLELQGNNLTRLDNPTLNVLSKLRNLTHLSLNNNPWICDCAAQNFSIALRENLIHQIVPPIVTCRGSDLNLLRLTNDDLCETNTVLIIILGALLFTILIVLAFGMALYYKYNQEIKVWLFAHNMFLWFVTEEELDKNKEYDAFISYSHKDEEFIVKHLMPELENGPNPYKLCIHVRDWMPGEFITINITQSVENSRRTIVVLSPHFLQSEWTKAEFRAAHTKAMSEGRTRVIVILYGEVDVKDLDAELCAYLKTNTYVKWGDPWFWQKLKYALPHTQKAPKPKGKRMENIMVTIDKMDLINTPSTPNLGSTPPAVSLDPLLLKENPLSFKPDKSVRMTPPAESGLVVTQNI